MDIKNNKLNKKPDDSKKKLDDNQIQIDLSSEHSDGHYSNLVVTSASQEEFILDFAFIQPHVKRAKVKSRIILSPRNAKKLMFLLQKNVVDYEKNNGVIDNDNSSKGIEFSFN